MPALFRSGSALCIWFPLASLSLAGQEQACRSSGRDEALGCGADQADQVNEDYGETVGLMQVKERFASTAFDVLNGTALEQLLKRDPDSEGYSTEQVKKMSDCALITCLNFLNPDHEQACMACMQEIVNTIESASIGVNGVALGYAKDMLSIPLSGGSYSDVWCGGDVATCTVKNNFPGPNTTSVMGWDRVSQIAAQTPSKEWSGEWWRGNELGFIINNPFFWSSNGVDPFAITLGVLPSQHFAVRPVMEALFDLGPSDSARYKEVQSLLTRETKSFLKRRAKKGLKVSGDIKAFVHQLLNLVAFNRIVSFSYAKEFVELQSQVVALGTISQLLPSVLYPLMKPMRDKVAGYVGEYATLIRERFGDSLDQQDCSPSTNCVQQAASMVWDAFYSAGGLSVPLTISSGIGLLFSKDASNPFPEGKFKRDQAASFYWENIRYFPPVVGFPHWETRPVCAGGTAESTAALSGSEGATTACPKGKPSKLTGYPKVNQYQGGVRVVPNLALAQRDPKKWGPDADKFVVRPLSEYSKSVGFAEPAMNNSVADGRMNRNCPAKELALMIGTTFFELFDKDEWAQPFDDIRFLNGPVFVSDFTLSSKQMVKDCEEVCPSCWDGLSDCIAKAKCEAEKSHCTLCKDCEEDPPSWWDLIKQAACATC